MNDLMTKSFLNYVDLKKEAMKDLEAGPNLEMAFQDTTLDRFFEEVNRIKGEMEGIQDLLPRLHDANEEGKTTHKPDALKSLHVRINAYITTILKKARLIRSKLEELDRENQANRRLSGFREGTPIDRTRTSVTNGLRKKLKELMMEFQDLRQKIMSEYKQTVERRYFTITGENPDEEVIEKIISTGDSEDLLKKAIQEQGRGKVLATVYEIQDRHDAAKEIEKSLLELHQVFLDMAVMVETQAEQLDDIEQHVINAASYVKGGVQELSTAKKYQKSNRKWLCIGMIILLILVLLIVVPIATSLHKA